MLKHVWGQTVHLCTHALALVFSFSKWDQKWPKPKRTECYSWLLGDCPDPPSYSCHLFISFSVWRVLLWPFLEKKNKPCADKTKASAYLQVVGFRHKSMNQLLWLGVCTQDLIMLTLALQMYLLGKECAIEPRALLLHRRWSKVTFLRRYFQRPKGNNLLFITVKTHWLIGCFLSIHSNSSIFYFGGN